MFDNVAIHLFHLLIKKIPILNKLECNTINLLLSYG